MCQYHEFKFISFTEAHPTPCVNTYVVDQWHFSYAPRATPCLLWLTRAHSLPPLHDSSSCSLPAVTWPLSHHSGRRPFASQGQLHSAWHTSRNFLPGPGPSMMMGRGQDISSGDGRLCINRVRVRAVGSCWVEWGLRVEALLQYGTVIACCQMR